MLIIFVALRYRLQGIAVVADGFAVEGIGRFPSGEEFTLQRAFDDDLARGRCQGISQCGRRTIKSEKKIKACTILFYILRIVYTYGDITRYSIKHSFYDTIEKLCACIKGYRNTNKTFTIKNYVVLPFAALDDIMSRFILPQILI